ncbi:MAG: P1 family peptidase [Chloroflexota bacterium]|jgi:L-aminopeptidase/D-esterase-like protein
MKLDSILDVPGIRVGHYTDLDAATGCTVLLCDRPMVGSCLVSGGAPGERETALLDPSCLVQEVHAILLSGGSAFGLDAAGGVMRYLEEHQRGFDMKVARVPIVPTAILFDLSIGNPMIRPGPEDGYEACLAARSDSLPQGNVGAGTGATVGKVLGMSYAVKAGLGSASVRLPDDTVVGAIAAVNCVGDVVDPDTGRIIAGTRHPGGKGFLNSSKWLHSGGVPNTLLGGNTTLAVVATNSCLSKAQARQLATLAQQGMSRAIRPITPNDGDVVFTLAAAKRNRYRQDLSTLGAAAAEALARAIIRSVEAAESLAGVPSAKEVIKE